ncbi:Thioredoxin-like [2Fe-2S] ferredoxin [Tindallia magadiensis]|uniref:Thioredoxin-like [2Fe-2S] ferredoxin n=1 Tax=Tindallia magadiensis TaxID=69895 RepID=A0A1I3C1Y2_9FIRM|nr:(2Fe-2S) ferredoxin domain-containing protein [Tindallia magadiensis]SFH67981.1 Thioredoxin-like [2Fe-2S] ferredoxin [Tindallia magadiensis]
MKTIHVCIGSACHLKGAYQVVNRFQQLVEEKNLQEQINVKAAFCLGHCTKAVSVQIDDGEVYSLGEEGVEDFLEKML